MKGEWALTLSAVGAAPGLYTSPPPACMMVVASEERLLACVKG